MKLLRILLIAFAVVIVGTIASAATGGVHGKPTPSPSADVSDSPEPTETEAPDDEATTSDETGTAPNFSACVGLTGLDNAICRHDALLKVKPLRRPPDRPRRLRARTATRARMGTPSRTARRVRSGSAVRVSEEAGNPPTRPLALISRPSLHSEVCPKPS